VIARATRPDQAVVTAPISELPLRVAELPGPVLVLVGQVLNSHSAIRPNAKSVGQKTG
jgi:siroheme synthase